MIELDKVPPELFAPILAGNLRQVGPSRKLFGHFLEAARLRLAADACWLTGAGQGERLLPGCRLSSGDPSLCHEDLSRAFLRREHPIIPAEVVLSSLVVHGRQVAVVGGARRGQELGLAARRALERPRQAIAAAGWRLEGRLLSCDALGGDLYLAHAGDDGLVWAVGDVVGHGVGAALYAGMLRSTLDAARRRSPEPREMIGELLDGIDFFEAAKYATLFYGLLLPDGELRYVNAGHPPALWQHDGKIDPLPATGFFLSTAFRNHPHAPGKISMQPSSRLLVYTDGASEACGADDQEFGPAGLAAALAQVRDLPLTDALDGMLDLIRAHSAGRPLDDDVTLLLIERTASGGMESQR
jgi:hypothetical protein